MAVDQKQINLGMSARVRRALRTFRAFMPRFPWWLLIILAIIGFMAVRIMTDRVYQNIFGTILQGLGTTLYVTAVSFVFALVLGLILGLGRTSRSIVFRNLSITYIEFIRGVPILVLIFAISFAVVPAVMPSLASLFGVGKLDLSLQSRAIIALVLIYSAYIAEIFRAGIESIGRGQMEAARSLGMSHVQSMRYIILPQAIRNVLPALGNDLIALLKDTSLVSVLGVREITQLSRLSVSQSFLYEETYFTLTLFYLAMTLILSLLLQWIQRRARSNGSA